MKLIRIPELVQLIGISRTTIWRLERSGQFPARIRTSARLVAWNVADVEAWLAAQPRGLAVCTMPAPSRGAEAKR